MKYMNIKTQERDEIHEVYETMIFKTLDIDSDKEFNSWG